MPVFTCNICNKNFDCFSKLQLHELSHSDYREFKCEECGKEFRRKSHLKDHLYLHSNIKEHKCEYCDKQFPSISILKRHSRRHLFKRIFKCQHCSKSFFELAKLRRHFDSHTGFRPHQCGYCERSFNHQADLKRHLLIHTEDYIKTEPDLILSERPRSVAKRKRKNLRCDQCGKLLATALSLREHLNIHMGTKPHKCEQCSKTFNKQIELRRHLMRHSGHRPYACIYCERCFFTKTELSRHVAHYHSNMTVLRCNHCAASFCQLSHLDEHMQTHFITDEHKCHICNVHFLLADDLKLHQQAIHHNLTLFAPIKVEDISENCEVYTEVNKFFCPICLKCFNYKCLLSSHMHSHRVIQRIRCTKCFVSFSHHYHLLAHSLKHRQQFIIKPHSSLSNITNLEDDVMQKLSEVKIKVNPNLLNKTPMEMWELVSDTYTADGDEEIVSCEIEMTFFIRKKMATHKLVSNSSINISNILHSSLCPKEKASKIKPAINDQTTHSLLHDYSRPLHYSSLDNISATNSQIFNHIANNSNTNTCLAKNLPLTNIRFCHKKTNNKQIHLHNLSDIKYQPSSLITNHN